MTLKKLIVLVSVLLFAIPVYATGSKLQLEILEPRGPFTHKVGEPFTIKFKSVSSSKKLFYNIILKHGDEPPWSSGSGPIMPKAVELKQGLNTFTWDGSSYLWAPTDAPEMGKLKHHDKSASARYYFKIAIYDNDKIVFVGMNSNAHKEMITSIRTKSFTLLF